MPKPIESAVRSVLGPYHDVLYGALTGGWSDYRASSEAGRWRRKSTRAAIVWERTIDRAIDAFATDSNVRVVEHHDTVSFVVADAVLFRFKKGDDERLTRNVPTGLARLFADHDADLFGYPGLQRVELIYLLDRWGTEVKEVSVVARDGDDVLWHYGIDPRPKADVLPFPPPAPPPSPPSTGDLARPRRDLIPADKKNKEDE